MRRRILILLVTYTVLLPATFILLGGCVTPGAIHHGSMASSMNKAETLNCAHSYFVSRLFSITDSDGSLGVFTAQAYGDDGGKMVFTVNSLEDTGKTTLTIVGYRELMALNGVTPIRGSTPEVEAIAEGLRGACSITRRGDKAASPASPPEVSDEDDEGDEADSTDDLER